MGGLPLKMSREHFLIFYSFNVAILKSHDIGAKSLPRMLSRMNLNKPISDQHLLRVGYEAV